MGGPNKKSSTERAHDASLHRGMLGRAYNQILPLSSNHNTLDLKETHGSFQKEKFEINVGTALQV